MRNVPEMKPLITEEWKMRLELMKELTKRKTTEALHLAVEKNMGSSQKTEEAKEEMAHRILQIIKPCKTDEEAIKALENI